MKIKLIFLLIFQIFSSSIFCQYHFLETLNDVLIGPHNVDQFYPEQVEFYTKRYNKMTNYIDKLIGGHEAEIQELEKAGKKKILNRGRINQKKEIIEILEIDKEIIEDYKMLWAGLVLGSREKDFAKAFDESQCYSFFANYKNISSQDCRIELDKREFLEWEEFMRLGEIEKKQHRQIIQPAGTKWIKKRADKNCLSNDPKDCMVWCLLEIPEEYQVINYYEEAPENFQVSEDRAVFYRNFSLENSQEKKYRIFTLRENMELNILDFKTIKCD
ncbi:MAG: hypothetical protein AB8H03_18430 [Saprospiraceae bacterium]